MWRRTIRAARAVRDRGHGGLDPRARLPGSIPQICDWFAGQGFRTAGVRARDTLGGRRAPGHRDRPDAARAADVELPRQSAEAGGAATCGLGTVPEQRRVSEDRDRRPDHGELDRPALTMSSAAGARTRGRAAMHGRAAAPDEQGADYCGQRRREDQDRLDPSRTRGVCGADRGGAPGKPAAEPGQPGPYFLDPGISSSQVSRAKIANSESSTGSESRSLRSIRSSVRCCRAARPRLISHLGSRRRFRSQAHPGLARRGKDPGFRSGYRPPPAAREPPAWSVITASDNGCAVCPVRYELTGWCSAPWRSVLGSPCPFHCGGSYGWGVGRTRICMHR